MIEVNGLTKRYGARTAVDNLSFTVRPGHVTGFLGPNGAGKTTTMRVILGLDAPTSGTTTVGGVPFRSHRRGLARCNGIPRRRITEVLDEVGLIDVAAQRVGGYSLGMKQRLGIATALLGDPPVLVFDEPINGMDPEGVLWVRRLAGEGRTVFLSSHLMSEMANTADELVVIRRGRLIAAEPVHSFAARNTRPSVAVGTPHPDELTALLTRTGAQVEPAGSGDADLVIVAANTGAATIVSEYSSGLIRTTTVAVPARGSVVLAKAVAIVAAWTLAGEINSTASFAVSQTILHGRHAGVSITDPGAFTALLGATLLAPVCALIGLGLGVLIRHSIATTVIAIVTLVEVRHRGGRDPPGDHRQHLLDDPERGAFHPAGDRAGRDRRAEQVLQRGGGSRD